jgi:hypothetical protein
MTLRTDRAGLDYLVEAANANDAFTDKLYAMIEHAGADPERDFDSAMDLVFSEKVAAALELPPRAQRARLYVLWKEWIEDRDRGAAPTPDLEASVKL